MMALYREPLLYSWYGMLGYARVATIKKVVREKRKEVELLYHVPLMSPSA